MGERGGAGCVPHDTIAAKDETYSEPNSPSHERAHSSQEKVLNELVSDCKNRTYFTECGETEGHVVRHQVGLEKWADALTFLPDRWLTTMSHGRRHSVLFDLGR